MSIETKGKTVAFQGNYGAFSDLACRSAFPEMKTIPCNSFEDAMIAVRDEEADYAMIPIDNTIAGRVADVHHLIPGSDLYIVAEHFQPVNHSLMSVKGATLEGLEDVFSHVHALPQCRNIIKQLGLRKHVKADTAGAAKEVAELGNPKIAAIASPLAAEIYGLEVLLSDVQDTEKNTTRFLLFSRERNIPTETQKVITSVLFRVRNIPAALYKALGGFATNGVNLSKLESYVDKKFQAARFFVDVEGHPDSKGVQLALEELSFFAAEVKVLGAYPAHKFRDS